MQLRGNSQYFRITGKSMQKKGENEEECKKNELESLLPSIISWLNFAQVDDLCSVIASTGPPAAGLSSQQLLAVVVVILGHCFVQLPFCAFAFDALKEIRVL